MDFDIGKLNVFFATPVNRDFPWQTTRAFIETAQALATAKVPCRFQFVTSGSQIDHDRSELAREFLATECNRIFWIDSDMNWDHQDVFRLLALSTVMPIVGASYPAKRGTGREFLIDVDHLTLEANEHGCFEIKGMGLGFAIMNREVIEKASESARTFTRRDGSKVPMIFRTGIDEDDGIYRSEDMHFFKKCRTLGYKVFVDPTIVLGHVGGYEWKGRLMDGLNRAAVA